MQEIKPLTSLRFLLAFWVLLYHFQDKVGITSGAYIDLIQLGYVAVTTFFVLSGFILSINYLYREKMVGYSKFLQARFSRIYPVYVFSILFSAPYYFFHVLSAPFLVLRILLCLLVLGIVLLMLQSWFAKLSTSINIPAWCLLDINSLMDNSAIHNQWTNLVYFIKFNPLLRVPEFILGVYVGILYNQKQILTIKSLTFFLLFLFFAGSLYVSRFQISYLTMHNGLFAIPSACLILLLSIKPDSIINRLLSNRVLVFLGKCSYALYLIHYSMINYTLELQKILKCYHAL